MTHLIQSLVDAISSGGTYALAALGLGLIFGVMRLANFAHGEFITAGAYTLVLTWHWGPVVSIVLTILVPTILAAASELLLFRHLRSAPESTLLIASFGLSYLLQAVYDWVFGSNARSAAVAPGLLHTVRFLGIDFRLLSLVTIAIAGVLLLGVHALLTRTPLGLHVRAASADFGTARLLGVRANVVILATFALSGVLAAAVAFVQTIQGVQVTSTFGDQITILALLGAVLGGIDRLGGALTGGFVVGFVISELRSWLPGAMTGMSDTYLFAIVIVLLLVRPNGLLRTLTTERT